MRHVIKIVSDVMAPNKYRAIRNNRADSIETVVSVKCQSNELHIDLFHSVQLCLKEANIQNLLFSL